MPEWLSLAFMAFSWAGFGFVLAMYFRMRRMSRDIAQGVALLARYRPVIAAIDEHDAECTAYQATEIVIALFALRLGVSFVFEEVEQETTLTAATPR